MLENPSPANARTVDVDRERGVFITWDDGHASAFRLDDLRLSCPCAQCRDMRERGDAPWPRAGAPATLRIESAEQVGNWGLNIHWNDGHTTGIYTWETLRSWCPCDECEPPDPVTAS